MENVLLEKLETRFRTNDFSRIKKAILVAKKAHSLQVRKSGQPYIIHLLQTAELLNNLNLDADSIIAGILHDSVEDTTLSIDDIKKTFGKDIASLVEGVTKLSVIRLKKGWFGLGAKQLEKIPEFERQIETLRKMFLATGKDIRVILIKLADRLHNMRTLEYVNPNSQIRIARETLDIYAPIADRLGIGQWKGELEDLAFKYIYPKQAQELDKSIHKILKHRQSDVDNAKKSLYKFLLKKKIKVIDIQGRIKRKFSLYKKLQRYHNDISLIYDIVALRVIVPSEQDCYKTMEIIHNHWQPLPDRIKDYIAIPKTNHYRSLHTAVYGPGNNIIEIQIRDPKMHKEAEIGIAAHWYFKNHKNLISRFRFAKQLRPIPKSTKKWLDELSKWQKTIKDPQELRKSFRFDFFKNRIFIFTPQGDVKDIPFDSTPIDFAYAIHSEVGNRCVGAKVNGKMVTLNYKLQNGDVVEILTTKNSKKPNRDWLRFVKSSVARSHIRKALRD